MYYPATWNDRKETFPDLGPTQGWAGLTYNLIPDVHCDGSQGLRCSGVAWYGMPTDWFTNYTFNSNPTLPLEFYDGQEMNGWFKKKQMHPWGSPGSAATFGEGCGANGGNPNGCQAGEFDPNPYGTCCCKGGM